MELDLDIFHVYCSLFVRLFVCTCESRTMAKHLVQAMPCVYCPPVPNYIVTIKGLLKSITQLLGQQCVVNSNLHS